MALPMKRVNVVVKHTMTTGLGRQALAVTRNKKALLTQRNPQIIVRKSEERRPEPIKKPEPIKRSEPVRRELIRKPPAVIQPKGIQLRRTMAGSKMLINAADVNISRLKDVGKGRILVIVGNGPSILEAPLERLKNVEPIDIMSINKPDKRLWPTRWWAFCDQSQCMRNPDQWHDLKVHVITSTAVRSKDRTENRTIVRTRQGRGFSKDLTQGYHISRSSVYANMQTAYYMNYDKIFIFGCLPDDENILTTHGMKPINKLDWSDLVYTTNGFVPFDKISRRHYDGSLYSFVTWMNNIPLNVTAEHPILIYRNDKNQFIEAKQVNENDWCIFPIDQTVNNDRHDGDFWWMVGLYAAGGYINILQNKHHYAKICLRKHEKELMQKLKLVARKTLNRSVSGDTRKRPTEEQTICSDAFGKFVEEHIGKGAKEKFLSHLIMTLPLKKQIEFIRGLLDGDGSWFVRKGKKHKNVRCCTLSTASESLAECFQKLLLRLGVISGLTRSRRPSGFLNKNGNFGIRHHVYIIGKQLNKLSKLMNGQNDHSNYNTLYSYINNNNLYVKMRKIETKTFTGFVNNIQVNNAHTYGSRLIMTHNCDMCADPKTGKLHYYGTNPDVTPDVRKDRFKYEAESYQWAADNLTEDERKRYVICSTWNPWPFATRFGGKLDHETAVDEALKLAKEMRDGKS